METKFEEEELENCIISAVEIVHNSCRSRVVAAFADY
jgi:hypothetical protein